MSVVWGSLHLSGRGPRWHVPPLTWTRHALARRLHLVELITVCLLERRAHERDGGREIAEDELCADADAPLGKPGTPPALEASVLRTQIEVSPTRPLHEKSTLHAQYFFRSRRPLPIPRGWGR